MLKIAIDLSSKPKEQITQVNDAVENCDLDSDELLDAIDKRTKIQNDDPPPPPPGGPPPGDPPNCGGAVRAVELKKHSCKNYELNTTITMQATVSVTDCKKTVHQIPISANLNCVGSITVWPGCEVYMPSSNRGNTENGSITLKASNAIGGHISIGGGGSIIDREDIPVYGQLNYVSLINACRASDGAVLSLDSVSFGNEPIILTSNSISDGYIYMAEKCATDCEKISIYEQSNRVSLINECYTSVAPAMSAGGDGARNRLTMLTTNSINGGYTSMVERDASGEPAMSAGGDVARNRLTMLTTNSISSGYTSMVERDASGEPAMSAGGDGAKNRPTMLTTNNTISGHISICGGNIIDCEDISVYGQSNYASLINECYASGEPAMSPDRVNAGNGPITDKFS